MTATLDPDAAFVAASAATLDACFPEPACDECRERGRHVPATHSRTRERKTLHVCAGHKAYYERLDWSIKHPVVKGLRPEQPTPPPFQPLNQHG